MKLEELIDKYEINYRTPKKFHKELLIYYNTSKNPTYSKQTEIKYLNNLQLDICREFKINYPTFLRNLELLDRYKQLSGGRN